MTEELQKEPLLFDKTALARALGVADASTLVSFYEIYLQQARPLLEV